MGIPYNPDYLATIQRNRRTSPQLQVPRFYLRRESEEPPWLFPLVVPVAVAASYLLMGVWVSLWANLNLWTPAVVSVFGWCAALYASLRLPAPELDNLEDWAYAFAMPLILMVLTAMALVYLAFVVLRIFWALLQAMDP